MYEFIDPANGNVRCLVMPIDHEGAIQVTSSETAEGWIAAHRTAEPCLQLLRDAVAAHAREVLRFTDPPRATLVLDLLYAYEAQVGEVKAARQAIVADQFAKYLGPSWAELLRRAPDRHAFHMASAHLVPDVFLRDYVGAVATLGVLEALLKLPPDTVIERALAEKIVAQRALRRLFAQLDNFGTSFSNRLCELYQTRPLAEVESFAADLHALLRGNPERIMQFAACLRDHFSPDVAVDAMEVVRHCDAQARLLSACVQGRLEAMDGMAAALAVRVQTMQQHRQGLAATCDALRVGRDLGSVGADIASALRKAESDQVARDARMFNELLQRSTPAPRARQAHTAKERLQQKLQARAANASPQGGNPPSLVAAADPSAVHAWSVERLAEWIDGPPSQIKKAIDRKGITARQTAGLAKDTKKPVAEPLKPPPGKPSRNVPQPTPDVGPHWVSAERNVELVVHNALRECARFLLEDAREMSQRSEALGLDKDVKSLGAVQTQLHRILEAVSIDEVAAAACFDAAEQAIRDVRRAANKAEAGEQFRRAFPRAVADCLKKEVLCFGKRTGGVIEPCDFRREYWGWVGAEFHGRCLAVEKVATPTGEGMWLREDQALAFYVTGSSLSGYAFDISVHLWRRREQSKAPPADERGFMNEADWYDTRIPYAVLHVGRGR